MILSFQNLKFDRNHHNLFFALNCDVLPGECLQIVGANGSGKTTLLRILAALLEPEQGNVLWGGHSIFKTREDFQLQLLYLSHKNAVKLNLTVYENAQLQCALKSRLPQKRILLSALEQLGLAPMCSTYARHLSAGQRRRLSMVQFLLNPAPLWALDEPMSAIDLQGQALWMALLNDHLKNKGMVVITAHQTLAIQSTSKKIILGEAHA